MKIVLFGAGNQARYVIDIIEKVGLYEIVGIIDSIKSVGSFEYGHRVLGRQENVKSIVADHKIEGGIITIGDNWSRHIVHECVISEIPNFMFVSAIHPSVIIANEVSVGVGVVIMAGCILNSGATINDYCFMATGAQLEHNCYMEAFSSLSAGSVMGGYVHIGSFSAITMGVTIIDRVVIGEHTVIGSGSLVLNDVPSNVVAFGSPAQVIRQRSKDSKYLK